MNFLKKNIKWIILVIILMIIVSGVSAYATSTYLASQVVYKDGKTVANALDDLYRNKKETSDDEIKIIENGQQSLEKYYKNFNVNVALSKKLLWTNSNPTGAFAEQTISLDLSGYQYAIIDCRFDSNNEGTYYKTIIEIGQSGNASSNLLNGYVTTRRDVSTSNSGITFSIGKWSDSNGTHTGTTQCIPYHIWGLK